MLKVRSDYIYYGTEWSQIYINLCYIVSAENWELRTVQILLNCNEVLEKKEMNQEPKKISLTLLSLVQRFLE